MSLKSYRNVTLDEMRNILKEDKGWNIINEPSTKEYIFQFALTNSPEIVIRVCSGIVPGGNSRECGKDAIRIFALDTKNRKGYIKTKRVYRIQTWEKNLKKAVMECFEKAKKRRENQNNY